jgi:hypothetical protein
MKPIWLNVWEYRDRRTGRTTVEAAVHADEGAAIEDIAEDMEEPSGRTLVASIRVGPKGGAVFPVDFEPAAREHLREAAEWEAAKAAEGRALRFRQAGV